MVTTIIKDEGTKTINVGEDFSRFPAGRVKTYGPHSAEAFRDDILIPALKSLKEGQVINLEIDDTAGYGSNFLEEAFGGLVRKGHSPEEIKKCIKFKSDYDSLVDEIIEYIEDAGKI